MLFYVAEMDPGVPDDLVLQLADRESAVLITADKDFGELVFRQARSSSGVVLIRLQGLSPAAKAGVVSEAIAEHQAEIPGHLCGSEWKFEPHTLRSS